MFPAQHSTWRHVIVQVTGIRQQFNLLRLDGWQPLRQDLHLHENSRVRLRFHAPSGTIYVSKLPAAATSPQLGTEANKVRREATACDAYEWEAAS